MTADEAWAALNAELVEVVPLCKGLGIFTADRMTDDDRSLCESVCAACPVFDLCDAYATTADVPSGFWAGHQYTPKGRT